MQYALINNIRSEAKRGLQGICPTCNKELIAKCGPRTIHHWAHKHILNCDPWWENETEWHRAWKAQFPEDNREISHFSDSGEVHRADIKTYTGIIVEIQNSPISDQERISREEFYQNLVWVINGEKFKNNFEIHHNLPDPKSEIAKDIVWLKSQRRAKGANHGLFWYRSKNPDAEEGRGSEITKNPCDYFQYDWIRPRAAWLESNCPVFIDFGEDYLVLLTKYETQKYLPSVRLISKKKFIHDATHEKLATDIGSRFYRVN